nr:A24 family peptidase [Deinobacterium chartae]
MGALIGSFSNVLIHRIPRRESVAFPPSHCPHCQHRLGPADLVPVLSWLFLRGRCRYCAHPISPRYPVVELISATGYGLIAAAFPPATAGLGFLGLWVLFTLLLVGSAIDLDIQQLPDELTLPGVLLGLLFAVVNALSGGAAGLPTLEEAVKGALIGAGVLVLIGNYGSWVLRRFREPRFPDHPIGYMQISLAGLVGAWSGGLAGAGASETASLLTAVAVGSAAALVSAGLNVALRRVLRIPDALTLGGLLLSLVLGVYGFGPGLILMLQGGLAAAGAASLIAAFYWWIRGVPDADDSEDYDPIAMGFGDVKLVALIGAFLGWEKLLVALAVAVALGALLGLVVRLLHGQRQIPFGPYLAGGALIALFYGEQIIRAYLGYLG